MLHKVALHLALLLVWTSAEVPSTAEVQADQPQENPENVNPEEPALAQEEEKTSEQPEALLEEESTAADEEQESSPEETETEEEEAEENPAEALLEEDSLAEEEVEEADETEGDEEEEEEEEEEEPPPLPTNMPAKMEVSCSPQAVEVAVMKSAAPPAIKENSSVSENQQRDDSECARQKNDDMSLLHGEVQQELREVKEAAQGAKDDIILLRMEARQEHESARHQLAEEERLARQRLEEFERRARERLEEAGRTMQKEEAKPWQASRGTTRSRPPSKGAPAGGEMSLRALELKLRQRNDKLRRGNDALYQENARLRKLRECSEAAAKLGTTNEKMRNELCQQLGSRRRSAGRSEAGDVTSAKSATRSAS